MAEAQQNKPSPRKVEAEGTWRQYLRAQVQNKESSSLV